jgi:hypothetical protein
MHLAVLYVRLLVATAGAVASAVFVGIYSRLSVPVVIARDHLRLEQFPQFTQWLAQFCWYALLIPTCFLASGVLVLNTWKNKAAFELVVGCQWLFALLWFAAGLLVWLLPQIPYGE